MKALWKSFLHLIATDYPVVYADLLKEYDIVFYYAVGNFPAMLS